MRTRRSAHRVLSVALVAIGLAGWPGCPQPAAVRDAPMGASSSGPAAAVPPLTREEEVGRQVFERYCAFCHGDEGDGHGINAPNLPVVVPDLTQPALQAARSDRDLVEIVARGGRAVGRSPSMPPWGRRLDARQIKALVAYLRTLARRSPRAGDGQLD